MPDPLNLQSLTKLSLSEVEARLDASREGPNPPQLWNAVRVYAVGGMQDEKLPESDRQRWAEIALAAITMKVATGESDTREAAADAARVRGYLIINFGPTRDEGTRDPQDLARTAISALDLSREEVAAAAQGWRDLPIAEILALRRVKNVLTALRQIQKELPPEEELTEEIRVWVDLIPFLP